MDHEPSSVAGDGLSGAVAAVRSRVSSTPDVALVLGSGLGPLAEEIQDATAIAYADIPGMPVSTAPGHAGRLVLGSLAGRNVVAMQGRVHLYEGFTAAQCAFPVRVMHALGARSLLVSNACGGLDPDFRAGDLMLHADLINATGQNPLTGPNDQATGPRFPVMFDCYDPAYRHAARAAARAQDMGLQSGVYLAIAGPSYATRAELRAFRLLGADAIGMSTVHEVIAARHAGMRVVGLSTVTDMALPDRDEHATGEQVLRVAEESGERFRCLVRALLPEL
ncbi:MAG TPA: purine-nucleoside phosphorylase [Trueperaceae bacterium]|nr:purine-nucleoside phosphorylase [Trueperaceae bacterium]